MKRILALDGGGIGAFFTLQVLAKIEKTFRDERGRADLVLRDEFDMFAGTSVGAIIATGLAWGMSVEQVQNLFDANNKKMFAKARGYSRWFGKYRSEPLADLFRDQFYEDETTRTPATLGTRKMWVDGAPKYLLVVMRNASTGSPWPVTNNPRALFNDPTHPDCNLKIPIWKLLRASTAAPTFFRPEVIHIDGKPHLFVDGGITPYNNPALIAVLMATLPCYKIEWPTGPDKLLVVSVGTCRERVRFKKGVRRLGLLDHAEYVPMALLSSVSQEQDLVCRLLGDCLCGDTLDSELCDLAGPALLDSSEKKFTYVRYNYEVAQAETDELRALTKQDFTLDNLAAIPWLQNVGQRYAARAVRPGHLHP